MKKLLRGHPFALTSQPLGAKSMLVAGLAFLAAMQAYGQKSITDELLDDSNGTRIEIRSIFDPMPPTGYAPLRIVATNGAVRDAVWHLDFSSTTQDYRRNNVHTSSLALPMPGRSTQSALFFAPIAPNYGDTSSYRNNGQTLAVSLNGPVSRVFSSYESPAGDFPAIAVSKALADNSMDGLKDEVERRRKAKSSYYGGSTVFGSRFNPDDAPEDWLGFSGFDFVMITDIEWQKLKPGVRNALLQWARLGGRLHFYCKGEPPAGLPADNKAYGLGKIATFTWNGNRLMSMDVVTRYLNSPTRMNELMSAHTSSSGFELFERLGKRSFNSWQVVVFLVIFGILVGPVNLFVLAPSGRRHRLFITTPLLSLGASLAMVGVILFQDGIGGIGARYVFINVEPEEAAAYVTQKQVSRTGVLFGSSFEVKQPALIEPLTLPASEWVKLKNSHDAQPVSLTQGSGTRGGNFFQSRTEQAQMIRMAVSTRARLEVKPGPTPDEPPTVVSALGFTVEEMFYMDAAGTLWSLKAPLATGQKADLAKVDASLLRQWWDNHQKAAEMTSLTPLVDSPKNHFFASAKAAPGFSQDTLSSIRWQQDDVLVYGSVTPP